MKERQELRWAGWGRKGSQPRPCWARSIAPCLLLRCVTKALFNAQFGSIFRTFHNPTYFSRRLVRFSDLYMASLSCLLHYRVDFTFYPRRTPLQHEAPLWMDQLCTGCMKTPFLGDMAHIR